MTMVNRWKIIYNQKDLNNFFMKGYKTYFKDKKVTVLGLGLLGKRIEDIKFLSESGAHVLVTDLKSKKDLKPSLEKLKNYKNITYHLGGHYLEDFENKDFILKGQGTPLNSIYIEHAKEQNIPIWMDESLFFHLAPKNIKVIGVTGTRGKTTTTMMIYHTLKKVGEKRVFLGGNIKGTALLPYLKKVRESDVFVLELSSWQLQGFGDSKISPNISVFTNLMPDHLNYYGGDIDLYFKDKSYIYRYQTSKDFCVVGENIFNKVKKEKPKCKLLKASKGVIPKAWSLKVLGEHNIENAACATLALKSFGLSDKKIKEGLESFKGVSGRLEFIKKYKGIYIYNDTCATTPEALIQALRSFKNKHVVLIMGGTTKYISLVNLILELKNFKGEIILIPGNGTDEFIKEIKKINDNIKYDLSINLSDAIKKALVYSTKDSVLLFSPGFASFGMFKNEYDRGDQFNNLIKKYK
jgi:UDP-N-acetylmuramoylalanine--D-glutamate ligase